MEIMRYRVISLLLLLTLIMASCVQSPALTLVAVDVLIVTDEELGSVETGEGEDEVLFIPTVVQYKLILENVSKNTIGSSEKPIHVYVENENKLIQNSIEVGESYRGPVTLDKNEAGEIDISYDLMWIIDSRSNENAQLPKQEQIDEIEIRSTALDAMLIITEGETELMRIDLREYNYVGE